MLSFSTWRSAARIPWVRENLDGLRYLRSTLYLLLALHRSGRQQDFQWTLRLFLEMAHSFAQYGHAAAKETINGLFGIPWFFAKRRALLTMIAAYNRVRHLPPEVGGPGQTANSDWGDVAVFVANLKEILDFNREDETRISALMADPEALDSMLFELHSVVCG